MEKLSYSQEDYLEEIYNQVLKYGFAKVTGISEALNVKKASVTAALNLLSEKKLINYTPYSSITLTNQGEGLAKKILDRHNSMAAFFHEILNLSPEQASENACKMEHILSDELYEKFLILYSFIKDYASKDKIFADEINEKLY